MNGHDASRCSYDTVAGYYDAAIGDELAAKPIDRALLAALAEHCRGGLVADIGSGPGQVAAHLAAAGTRVVGIDLSPGMCAAARRRAVPAAAGDLVAVPLASGCLTGLVCWYALIHLDADERMVAYQEMARLLRAGGWALIAFHTADADAQPGDARHLDTWFDQPVDLTFRFLDPDTEIATAHQAGLHLAARLDRQPVPGEHPSARTYLLIEHL